ncbi:hypothetical protein DSL92_05165 [Billgrantia gudaonensis]|uniref:Uncharacterized protein n=1 Tax=Billgrantia gudaonensis TaxID=376427 RepID=A0A3S0QG07_9GAMM|nr:hypothetical protein DSL92_05165 [Halomonas gudaonensis]
MIRLNETVASFRQPLLLVQFLDARHVRIYGSNSLPGIVLERLGLRNAWDSPSSRWGFRSLASVSYSTSTRISSLLTRRICRARALHRRSWEANSGDNY